MASQFQIKSGIFCKDNIISKKNFINYAVIIITASFLLRLLFLGSFNLLVEEAYYWNYAEHLDFGYLDHPPMVAFLIKISTLIFGTNEFGVRLPALICWMIATFFIFKLTRLINYKSSQYAVFLLAILPFFFLQSLVITPDQPLLACWSAALYCLYRALVFNESKYWYATGIFIGLGMLSKYTIVLLGLATLIYAIIIPSARPWLKRREPYISALIAAIIFSPVIYWNATHGWASFVFQSTRRFKDTSHFSLHYIILLLIAFLMPLGFIGLIKLFKKKDIKEANLEIKTQRFLQIFTITPLIFFGVFSLNHSIKLDWIGPGLLAVIPWLAILISNSKKIKNIWLVASIFMLLGFGAIISIISFTQPNLIPKEIFRSFISWEDLTIKFNNVASKIEKETKITPVFISLDLYNLGSELSFYQAKLLAQNDIAKIYPVIGRHIFGYDSLMYRYWSEGKNLHGIPIILISTDFNDFYKPEIKEKIIIKSPLAKIWSKTQGWGKQNRPYYYVVAERFSPPN